MQVLDGGGVPVLLVERVHQIRARRLKSVRRQSCQTHPGPEHRIGVGHPSEVIAPTIEDQRTDVIGAIGQELRGDILLRNPLGDLAQVEAHLHPQAAAHHLIVLRGHVIVTGLEANQLQLIVTVRVVGFARLNHRQRIGHAAGSQCRVEGIVVSGGNGIELVIMASGTGHGEAHQAP